LNASEEPELPDYPKDPAFIAKFGPRGVLDCKATTLDDPTVDPRFGKVGKQTIKDTGPLTRKRMETIDDDIAARAVDFIQRQNSAGKPAFVWVCLTHMHFRTHTKPESIGQSGRFQSPYHDSMIDHDKNVGTILKALDDLGIWDMEFYTENPDTHFQNGIVSDLEVLAIKRFKNGFGIGFVESWIQQVTDDEGTVADALNGFVGRAFGIGPIITYSTKIGKSHLDLNARWIHDFDVSKRVEGDGFNFTASLKF
jgi:Putative MetA-pathway of phenol degradation/Sulfatase